MSGKLPGKMSGKHAEVASPTSSEDSYKDGSRIYKQKGGSPEQPFFLNDEPALFISSGVSTAFPTTNIPRNPIGVAPPVPPATPGNANTNSIPVRTTVPSQYEAVFVSAMVEYFVKAVAQGAGHPEMGDHLFQVISQQLPALGLASPATAAASADGLSNMRHSYLQGLNDVVLRQLNTLLAVPAAAQEVPSNPSGSRKENSEGTANKYKISSLRKMIADTETMSRGASLSRLGDTLNTARDISGFFSKAGNHVDRQTLFPYKNEVAGFANGSAFRTAGIGFGGIDSTFSANLPFPAGSLFIQSRYSTDFQQLSEIGKGGFGRVYRVRNRLDGAEYAVKKIPVKKSLFEGPGSAAAWNRVLQEVTTMAKLDHPNVVRYHSSWIEQGPIILQSLAKERQRMASIAEEVEGNSIFQAKLKESPDFDEEEERGKCTSSDEIDIQFVNDSDQSIHGDKSNGEVDESGDGDEESDDDDEESDEDDQGYSTEDISRSPYPPEAKIEYGAFHRTLTQAPDSSEVESEVVSDVFSGPAGDGTKKSVVSPNSYSEAHFTLHIQMSIHPLTLTKYLMADPPVSVQNQSLAIAIASHNSREHDMFRHHYAKSHCFCLAASMELFSGILAGVEYLHEKGIVHRDLKPGNIFLTLLDPPRGTLSSTPCATNIAEDKNTGCSFGCGKEGCGWYGKVVPKIGDFGLVADIKRSQSPSGDDGKEDRTKKPPMVGTEFYRPPVEDERRVKAGEKTDVYALGVVLFECAYSLETRMERVFVLNDLTIRQKLPDDFAKKIGAGAEKIAQIVKGCVEHQLDKRWSMEDLREAVEEVTEWMDALPTRAANDVIA